MVAGAICRATAQRGSALIAVVLGQQFRGGAGREVAQKLLNYGYAALETPRLLPVARS